MNMIFGVKDRPKFGQTILFAIQQLLAIMAATLVVPVITNGATGSTLSPAAALFGAGVGTLVYLLFTKFRSPVFLGSSFAFLGSMAAAFAGGVSMTLGYVGLRYIELSISSPICNSSGALVAVLCLCTGALSDYNGPQKAVILCAVGLVCLGVVGLGVVEAREDDDLRRRRQEHANRKYAKSWLAICLPVAYCLLDAAGTFADSLVLERLNEDSANVAYELTFLAAGIGCLVYLLARREKFTFKAELPKYVGAACETVGQLFYIYALADEEHVMMSAPIISAYCVASVLWSRLFLKEKLSWKHYLMIGFVVAGIVILGIYDI